MTRTPIHPGEHLAEQLEVLGMSAAALARQLQGPTNRVTAIINGDRAVTGDTALRLGHFFGTSPDFWLNLQSLYDIRIAERKKRRGCQTPADIGQGIRVELRVSHLGPNPTKREKVSHMKLFC
jgi:addiction module HigA family antidote